MSTRLVLLLFLALPLTARTGPARAGGDPLYDIAFSGESDVWAVGAYGTILRSRDAGRTWSRQPSGTVEPLFGVAASGSRVWAVGRGGQVRHTADGGVTWRPQESGTAHHLFSVDFATERFGCAVGDWGEVRITRDGGRTWEDRNLGRDLILTSVFLLDARRGWIVGEAGTILQTRDGGRTWTTVDAGVDRTLYDIVFRSPHEGIVVGMDGLILVTTDGGLTWRIRHGSRQRGSLERLGFMDVLAAPALYGVAFAGEWAIAVGDLGAVLHSADGGDTWERRSLGERDGANWLRAVAAGDGGVRVLVGAEQARWWIDGDEMGEGRDAAAASD